MIPFEGELKKVSAKLERLSSELIKNLDVIFEKGIPKGSDKIVIWIPLGHRYNLTFTYMKNDASEIDGDYSDLSVLDKELGKLIDTMDDLDDFQQLTREVDVLVASWLKRGLEGSNFSQVKLQKVMAINNVCAYFDLNTLNLLEDDEIWY